MKRNGIKVPSTIHGLLGIIYYPNENVIADYLGNRFTSHDLCDESHERHVDTGVQDLLASLDYDSLGKIRSYDIHKLVSSLKLRKLVEMVILKMNALGIFQEDY
jgi:hypothetical protein